MRSAFECCMSWARTSIVQVTVVVNPPFAQSPVKHAADEGEPLDAALVVEIMNLLTSRDRVRDLHSLRLVCTLTMRGSFPVPSYPFLELPTSVIADFVGGSGSKLQSGRSGSSRF